eukprot:g727.t1
MITGRVMWLSNMHGITREDYWYCLIMFGCMTAARAAMMLAFAVPLKLLGYGTTPRDALFMVWGGLRGAVGLALAMVVESNISPQEGARVIFHISGISALTLLVNGVTSGPLLKLLGMVGSPAQKRPLLASIRRKIREEVNKSFEKEMSTRKYAGKVDRQLVLSYVDILGKEDDSYWSPQHHMLKSQSTSGTPKLNRKRVALMREIFLHVLRQEYWHMIETEALPKRDRVAVRLLNSIDCATDNLGKPLHDWNILASDLEVPKYVHLCMGFLDRLIPKSCNCLHDWWYETHDTLVNAKEEATFQICRAFVTAHEHAQEKLVQIFTSGEGLHNEEQTVVQESVSQVEKAKAYLHKMHDEVTDASNGANMARLLLKKEQSEIQKLLHQGLLNDAEADEFMEQVTANLEALKKLRMHQSKMIAHNHTLQRKHLREAAMRVVAKHHRMRLSSVVKASMKNVNEEEATDASMTSTTGQPANRSNPLAPPDAGSPGFALAHRSMSPSSKITEHEQTSVLAQVEAEVQNTPASSASLLMMKGSKGQKVHPGPAAPEDDMEAGGGRGANVAGDGVVAEPPRDAVEAASMRRKARREARRQRREQSKVAAADAQQWTQEEVADWLCEIGAAYARYSQAFLENGIDGETLFDAHFAENLEELGVTSNMHRNRITKEIAKIKGM